MTLLHTKACPSPFPPPHTADNCHLHAEPAAPRAGPGRAAPPGVWEERGQLPGEEGARALPEEATGTPFTTSCYQATPPRPAHAPAPAQTRLRKKAFPSPQPAVLTLSHRCQCWPGTLGLLVFTTEKQGASEEASVYTGLRPSTTGSGKVQKY